MKKREVGSDVKRKEMFVKETSALRRNREEEELILPTHFVTRPSIESTVVVRLNAVEADSCM